MSDMESKMVVRGFIRSLEGVTDKEAYEFFRTRVGEPEELDFEDDFCYLFYSDPPNGGFKPVNCRGGWAIDYIFEDHGHQYHPHFFVNYENLKEITEDMRDNYGVLLEDVSIQAYTWYNGVDEPRYLKREDIK